MEFLYRIQPTRPGMLSDGATPEEEAAIEKHFEYLKGLTGRGIVVLAGRTLTADDRSFGIVVFRAESEAGADALMNRDPAVSAGVMRAELYPFRVALLGAGLA